MPSRPWSHRYSADEADAVATFERAAIASVLSSPGVAAVVPSFRQAIRRVQHAALHAVGADQPQQPAEGIELTWHGERVDVHVEIAVAEQEPALKTARRVREDLQTTLNGLGCRAGQIQVTVLELR